MNPAAAGYRKTLLLTTAVCGVLLLIRFFQLPPGAVWITDNGNKYILMRNVLEHGSASVENPARELDPAGEFFPDGGFHFHRVNGAWRSVYPEFFSVLTIPFYWLFGERGVAFLPILGTLAVLSCFLALLSCYGRFHPAAGFGLGFLLVFATPFVFYSLIFWEMTTACALLAGAVLAVLNRKFLLGGLLLGCGIWLREELYFAAAALGIALLLTEKQHRCRTVPALASGALIVVAGLWILQWMQSGHILGLHGSLYYTHNTGGNAPTLLQQLSGGVQGYLFYFAGHITTRKWLLLLSALPVIAGAFPRFRSAFKLKACVLAASGISSFVLALELGQMPAGAAGMAVGVIPALPLAAGFFLNWRPLCRCRRTRMLTYSVLIYTLLLPPFLTRSDIGVIWSARHFLFAVPFFLCLAAVGLRKMGILHSRLLSIAVIPAVAAAMLLELHVGFPALKAVAQESAAATQAIRQTHGDAVVSDVFFLPEQTPQLFFERKWFFVKSGDRIPELIEIFKKQNIRDFTLVLSPKWRVIGDAELKLLLDAAPSLREIRHLPGRESGFLELLIAECRLQ